MFPKQMLYPMFLLMGHFNMEVPDHCYIFNRAPEWLLSASKIELQSVLNQPGFRRFSITVNGQIKELLNASHKDLTSLLMDSIYQSIIDNRSLLIYCKNIQPQVSYFQWNDYLERMEVYASGPVFVYFNDQLTHIWLDTISKK